MRSAQTSSPIYKNFSGGLNVRVSPNMLDDSEASQADNLRFDQSGGFKKRAGFQKLTSVVVPTTNNLIGVYQAAFNSAGTITRYPIATDGVKVYYFSAGTWNDITGAIVNTANANTIVDYFMFNNLMISADGVNAPYKWSGSGNIAALGGSPPKGNIHAVYNNYVFWAGVGSQPNRLYYSDVGNPESYPATSFLDVPTGYDGDPITGLAVLYGNLVIFKRYSIWVLRGDSPNNFTLTKSNSSFGCVSPYSIVVVDNLVYFVSDKGLYAFNLINEKQMCYRVETRYNKAVSNQLTSGSRNRIMGVHYRAASQIWMAIDATTNGQDQHDRIMVHDYINAWQGPGQANGDPAVSEYYVNSTIKAPSVMADYVASDGTVVPMCSFYDKYVYVFSESSNDDFGTAINTVWSSKFFSWDDPFSFKTLRFFHSSAAVGGGTPKIGLTASNDLGTSQTTTTLTPTPGTFWNAKSYLGWGPASMYKYYKFTFTSNDGGNFVMYEWGLDIVVKGRRN